MKMKRLLSALLCAVLLMTSVTVLAATNEATPGEATRCTHPNATVETVERDVTYAQDASTHTRSYNLVTVHTCPDCSAKDGDYEEAPVPKTDPAEAHSFADGKCTVCGYACPHASHDTAGRCTACGAACAHSFADGACPVCGAPCPHSYADGKCTLCGQCEHRNVRTIFNHNNRTVEVLDSKYCLETYDEYEIKSCMDCNTWLEQTLLRAGVQERNGHYYRNGENTCVHCGYQTTSCTHEHTEAQTYWTREEVVSKDANHHTIRSNLVQQVVCQDCNYFSSVETLEKDLMITKPHEMSDGVCHVCGYETGEAPEVCNHAEVEEETSYDYTRTVSTDESSHTMKATKVTEKRCLICGDCFETTRENDQEVTEPHSFYLDRCEVCNYVNPCKHEDTRTDTAYNLTYDYAPAADGHSFKGCKLEEVWCNVCDTLVSEKMLETNGTYTEPHTFEGGVCTLCGAEEPAPCAHRNAVSTTYRENSRIEPLTSRYHVRIHDEYEAQQCQDCGAVIGEAKLVQENVARREIHTYNGDTCVQCGQKNTDCKHGIVEEATFWSSPEVVSKDENGHTVTSDLMQEKICVDCNYSVSFETLEKGVTRTEPHDDLTIDGVCHTCGYESGEFSEPDPACKHPELTEEVGYEWTKVASTDAGSHTMMGTQVTYTFCTACEALIGVTREKDHTVTEPHDFFLDRCEVCGYVNPCKHEKTHTETEYVLTHDYAAAQNGHTFKGCKQESVWCDVCQSLTSQKVVEADGTYTEMHTFEGGVCALCGAKEPEPTATPTVEPTATPAAEPTATPALSATPEVTATPEPTATPAPSATPEPTATPAPTAKPSNDEDNDFVPTPRPNRVNNTTPEPVVEPTAAPTAAPMVDTLLSAVTEAEAEGKEVTIEVVGAQEIMTETEYTALKTLPAQEQILVTLASIGFEDVVEAATKALNVELSDDAKTLVTQVTERMAAVPQEERAAVEEKLAQYFPVEEVEIGGVKTSYFVIDLKIVVDGVERVERYGFRLDENGEWIFEKLDLQSVTW